MGIKLYDTVKDKSGKRFRVTETKSDGTGHIVATLKGINPDGSARRGMPRRVRLDVLESEYTRINLAPVEVKKIDDLRKEETKVTQVPTPSDKALEKQKEAVRALSEKEVEEALTKSTYGGTEEDVPPLDDMVGDGDPEALVREISRLNEYLHVLKAECLDLKEENKKYLREIDDYKKTISKMKYAHEEEVRALEDELAEAKALGKKAGEYCSMLDADSDTFETILELAKIIHGLAKNAESVSLLIKDEIEGHV